MTVKGPVIEETKDRMIITSCTYEWTVSSPITDMDIDQAMQGCRQKFREVNKREPSPGDISIDVSALYHKIIFSFSIKMKEVFEERLYDSKTGYSKNIGTVTATGNSGVGGFPIYDKD